MERTPSWAVGEWELTSSVEGDENNPYELTVLSNGTITIKDAPGIGVINSSGQLWHWMAQPQATARLTGVLRPDDTGSGTSHAEDEWTAAMTGRLRADGTGSGTGHGEGEDFTWTATKVPGSATEQGAPPWAVGQWWLATSARTDWRFGANVLPDGTIVAIEHSRRTGKGTIDPSGRLQYRVTHENWAATLTGTLTPEGTGGGLVHEETKGNNFGAFWTARQTLQLIAHTEPAAPEPVRAVPIPQAGPRARRASPSAGRALRGGRSVSGTLT